MDERRHAPAAPGGAAGEPTTTDREYARCFERGAVRNGDFHHREQLRVAWAYLEESVSATRTRRSPTTAVRACTATRLDSAGCRPI
jgi:hypothetical protein